MARVALCAFWSLCLCSLAVAGRYRTARFVDRCTLRPYSGICEAYIERWFFDEETHRCHEIEDGGCRGQPHGFVSLEECIGQCGAINNGLCYSEEPDEGPCMNDIFYYDVRTRDCEHQHGVCKEHKNHFPSREECRDTIAAVCGFLPELCPDGQPPSCTTHVSPCHNAKCEAFPNARCIPDYCDHCKARFFQENREVTAQCDTGIVHGVFDPVICKQPVCKLTKCPHYTGNPDLKCEVDHACNAEFYVDEHDVTDRCLYQECSSKEEVVQCSENPCLTAVCASDHSAKCVANYCDGCHAIFYNHYNEVVNCENTK